VTVPVIVTVPTDDRHGTEIVTRTVPPTGMLVHEQVTVWPATVHVARSSS
jgi:hypothetical protein